MRTSAAYADLFKRHSAGSPHYIVICNLLNVEGELAKGHDILTKNASLIFLLVRVCTVQCTVPSLSVTSTLFSHFTFTFYILQLLLYIASIDLKIKLYEYIKFLRKS